MPKSKTNFAQITGIQTTLGPVQRCIDDDIENFGGKVAQIERIKKTIGLNKRYVVTDDLTSLDLCEDAARRLRINGDVDAIIFVTQTPDHFQPCNAAKLHGRLGLPVSCAAFDVALGCSGWVYGLHLASLMIEAGGCERVLLAAGDTMSRCVHPRDRSAASLFGDGGTATLVEKNSQGNETWFCLHTDGSQWENIQVPAGGFRLPKSAETSRVSTDAKGNTRSEETLLMDGAEVFNFSIQREPEAIREILDFSGLGVTDIDSLVFHQANRFIISNIAKRLKFPPEHVPRASVEKFGNLSSASIPTAICDEVLPDSTVDQRIICSGFGVGLSWATALTTIESIDNFGISVFGK
jgi:3-oxoacyl-[acyl-carrier-protein] synthase-3